MFEVCSDQVEPDRVKTLIPRVLLPKLGPTMPPLVAMVLPSAERASCVTWFGLVRGVSSVHV
ncbi:MAG: hypothetical protein ACK47R_07270, partial [Planctomycetia bacterium]